MFNYQTLYGGPGRASRIVAFHAAAMSYVCKKTDGSQLASIASTLGLTSLQRRVVTQTNFPQYLVAQDAVGFQIYLDSPNTPGAIWTDMMTKRAASVASAGDTASKWLLRVADISGAILTDFMANFSQTRPLFFGGFGVGGCIMRCMAEQAIRQALQPRYVAMAGSERCMNDAMYDQLRVPGVNRLGLDDLWAKAPPAILSYAPHWQGTDPPYPDLYHGSRVEYIPGGTDINRTQANYFHYWIVNRSSPEAWPTAPNLSEFDQFHATALYVNRMWRWMNPQEQQVVSQWATVLNGNWPSDFTLVVELE